MRNFRVLIVVAVSALAVGLAAVVPAVAARSGGTNKIQFQLFPAPNIAACVSADPNRPAQATATVTRGAQNDSLTLKVKGFKPGLDFDLFTVQRSNQDVTGAPVTTPPGFGLAWYQSDLGTGHSGSSTVHLKTILLDQIFGFDPDVNLAPTNTFHLGFWFNDPNVAFNLGCEPTATSPIVTPFNGEHHAGPLAFITRPNAVTGLGPLCTNPNGSGGCNP